MHQADNIGGDEGLMRGSEERAEGLGSADRGLITADMEQADISGTASLADTEQTEFFRNGSLGRLGKGRGGGSGRQGGNIKDINNSAGQQNRLGARLRL